VLNAGLLLVDHIHFQYNGLLLGLLVLCLDLAHRRQHLALAFVFSCLVLMKHLFVTLAPVFGLYLIRVYVLQDYFRRTSASLQQQQQQQQQQHRGGKPSWMQFFLACARFLMLVIISLGALIATFAPFFLYTNNGMQQLWQIKERLLPFGRGLLHAYWAPNFWALYYFVDKVCVVIAKKKLLGSRMLQLVEAATASATGDNSNGLMTGIVSATSGIVGVSKPMLLPAISPLICLLIFLLALTPCLVRLWNKPSPHLLAKSIVYASMTHFMFGYHVHEKAILVPLVVQALVSTSTPEASHLFLLIAAGGIFGLWPLFLPTMRSELLAKSALTCTYLLLAHTLFSSFFTSFSSRSTSSLFSSSSSSSSSSRTPFFFIFSSYFVYRASVLLLVLVVAVYCELIHPYYFHHVLAVANTATSTATVALLVVVVKGGNYTSAYEAAVKVYAQHKQQLTHLSNSNVIRGSIITGGGSTISSSIGETSMPFLPLLLTSVSCALVLFAGYYLVYTRLFVVDEEEEDNIVYVVQQQHLKSE